MIWTKPKAPSVPISRSFLIGFFQNLLAFLRNSLKSVSSRNFKDLTHHLQMSYPTIVGIISLWAMVNCQRRSSYLKVSGIVRGKYFIVRSEDEWNGIRLTFHKDRHLKAPMASILLNHGSAITNGLVRQRILMNSQDWCTVIKLLNELSVSDIPDGSKSKGL